MGGWVRVWRCVCESLEGGWVGAGVEVCRGVSVELFVWCVCVCVCLSQFLAASEYVPRTLLASLISFPLPTCAYKWNTTCAVSVTTGLGHMTVM